MASLVNLTLEAATVRGICCKHWQLKRLTLSCWCFSSNCCLSCSTAAIDACRNMPHNRAWTNTHTQRNKQTDVHTRMITTCTTVVVSFISQQHRMNKRKTKKKNKEKIPRDRQDKMADRHSLHHRHYLLQTQRQQGSASTPGQHTLKWNQEYYQDRATVESKRHTWAKKTCSLGIRKEAELNAHTLSAASFSSSAADSWASRASRCDKSRCKASSCA